MSHVDDEKLAQRIRDASSGGGPLHIVIERPPFPWKRLFVVAGIAAGIYAAAWLWENLHEVFIMIIVAALLAFILDPLVVALSKKMPRWCGIVVTFVGLIAVLALAAVSIIPQLANRLLELKDNVPQIQASVNTYLDKINSYMDKLPGDVRKQIDSAREKGQEKLKDLASAAGQSLLAAAGWVGRFMIILVLCIYMLLDKDRLREGLLQLVPIPARAETLSVVGDVLVVLRSYLRGQIVVIGFVAVSVTGALLFIGMQKYALVVGTLAGILEIIPYFGAVVGAIPGVLYAFIAQGPFWGIFMICFFIVINQFEGHVVIPLVMGANLEMRPITVLLSLLVGHALGGVVGLIIAVPVCRILQVFIEHAITLYKDLKERTDEPMREVKAAEGPSAHEPGVGTSLESLPTDIKSVPERSGEHAMVPAEAAAVTAEAAAVTISEP